VRAESPHPLLASELSKVELTDAECSATLDFLRIKGTEALRQGTANPSAILIFEYRFTQRPRPPANYHKRNVQFGRVLFDVLPQFGLAYKVVGLDRIIIFDQPKNETPK
jgi:hypothetical protein